MRLPFRAVWLAAAVCSLLSLSGCATSHDDIVPVTQKLAPGLQNEETEIKEASLHFYRIAEERGAFYEDSALAAYLDEVAAPFIQSLGLSASNPIVFKVLRDPTINASALATGHIYVNAGLLARLETEAQLAFVLAHEISHVYHRDGVYLNQNLKRKTVAFKMLDLLLTPAASLVGAGGLSEMTLNVIYAGSIMGYGRDRESRADTFAIEELVKAGYPAEAALEFFDILTEEHKKYQRGLEVYFLSSHPANQQRRKEAASWLKEHVPETGHAGAGPNKDKDRYERETFQVRRDNVLFNLEVNRYFHALESLDGLIEERPEDPLLYFLKGEAYRRMPRERHILKEELSPERWEKEIAPDEKLQDKAWQEEAFQAYQTAVKLDSLHGPAYQGLGKVYFNLGELEQARTHFEKYLELNPNAPDTRSIKRYLRDIEHLAQKGSGV